MKLQRAIWVWYGPLRARAKLKIKGYSLQIYFWGTVLESQLCKPRLTCLSIPVSKAPTMASKDSCYSVPSGSTVCKKWRPPVIPLNASYNCRAARAGLLTRQWRTDRFWCLHGMGRFLCLMLCTTVWGEHRLPTSHLYSVFNNHQDGWKWNTTNMCESS